MDLFLSYQCAALTTHPHLSVEVKERVDLYSICAFMANYRVTFAFF